MTDASELVTVTKGTPFIDSMDLLLAHQISCLPVTDDGSDATQRRLCGIVTTTDFLRVCAALARFVEPGKTLPVRAAS